MPRVYASWFFLLIAVLCFILAAFRVDTLGPVAAVPTGLAFGFAAFGLYGWRAAP